MRKVTMPRAVLESHKTAFATYVEDGLKELLNEYRADQESCEYLQTLMIDPQNPFRLNSIVIRSIEELAEVVNSIETLKRTFLGKDWKPLEESLKKVFNYTYQFVQGHNSQKWTSGQYIKHMIDAGLVYCPYCNCNLIEVYPTCSGKIHKGPLDHFYDKDAYPYLALSIYNLIPVCDQCNREKGTSQVSLATHSHPFFDDFHELVYFEVADKPFDALYGNQRKCKIKLRSLGKERSTNAIKSADYVELVSRYNFGGGPIAREIYDKGVRYRGMTMVDYRNLANMKKMSLVDLCADEFGVRPDGADINRRHYGKLRNDLMPESLKKLR